MASNKIFLFNKYIPEYHNEEQAALLETFMEMYRDRFSESQLVCLTKLFSNIEFLGCKYPEKSMQLVAELSKEVANKYREKKLKRTFLQVSVNETEGSEEAPITNQSPQKITRIGNSSCCRHGPLLTKDQLRSEVFWGFTIYEGCNSSGELESCPIKILEESALKSCEWSINWIFPPDKNSSENTEKYCELLLNNKHLSSGTGRTDKEAQVEAAATGLKFLSKFCYTIQVKPTSISKNTVSSDNIQTDGITQHATSIEGTGGVSSQKTRDGTLEYEDLIEIQQLKEEFTFSSDEDDEAISSNEEDEGSNKCTVCHKLNLLTGQESDEEIYDFNWDTRAQNSNLTINTLQDDDQTDDEICITENINEEKPHTRLRYRPRRFRVYLPDGSFKRIRKDLIYTSKRLTEICQGSCIITYEDFHSDGLIQSLFPEFVSSPKYEAFLRSKTSEVEDQLNTSSTIADTSAKEEVANVKEPAWKTQIIDLTEDIDKIKDKEDLTCSDIQLPRKGRHRARRISFYLPDGSFKRINTKQIYNSNCQKLIELYEKNLKSGAIIVNYEDLKTDEQLREIFSEFVSSQKYLIHTNLEISEELCKVDGNQSLVIPNVNSECRNNTKSSFDSEFDEMFNEVHNKSTVIEEKLKIFLPDGSYKRVPIKDIIKNKELLELTKYSPSNPIQSCKVTLTDLKTSTALCDLFSRNSECRDNTESSYGRESDDENNDNEKHDEACSLKLHPEQDQSSSMLNSNNELPNEVVHYNSTIIEEKIKIFLPDGSYKRVPIEDIMKNKEILELTKYSPGNPIKSCKVTLTDLKTSTALCDLFSDFLSMHNLSHIKPSVSNKEQSNTDESNTENSASHI